MNIKQFIASQPERLTRHICGSLAPDIDIRSLSWPEKNALVGTTSYDIVMRTDGNGNDFFDPNQDGEIVQDLTPYLSKYIRKPLYRLRIIDHNVSIPKGIDKEYDSIDEAYEVLSAFVHSYDGVMQVDGRVMDEDDEDIEYSSSIM